MGVFCDRLKLGSTAALDCRTGQNKGRYCKKEHSYSSRCTHCTVKGATCLDDGSFTLSVLLAMQVLYSRLCWPLCKNTYADVLNLSDSLSTQ